MYRAVIVCVCKCVCVRVHVCVGRIIECLRGCHSLGFLHEILYVMAEAIQVKGSQLKLVFGGIRAWLSLISVQH